MSDLQIALILIGVVLLLGVVVFNWWQDKRAQRKMQQHFPEQDTDPLLGGDSDYKSRLEPAFDSVFASDNQTSEQSPVDDKDDEEQVDPTIEVVIDVTFLNPIDSIQIYSALQSVGGLIQKPIRIFAQTESGLHRSRLRSGESYSSLQFAILLANRQGPLTDIEWCKLWGFAQEMSERFEGSTEGPEIKEVQYKAQKLDQQCAQLDAQVGLVLHLHQAVKYTDLPSKMLSLGFVNRGKQIIFPSSSKAPYFVALFNENLVAENEEYINRINLLIDLPHSQASDNAFSRMAQIARELGQVLGADILTDNGTPLPENTDKAIDNQLTQFYQQLEQSGFTAGDLRTVRLFS